jgi:CO/xanthine dehydrogenase Mo-binding subunit
VEGGVPFSSHGLRACLEAGAERIGWRQRRRPNGSATGARRRGLGMAMGIYKGGVGREAAATVRLTRDGRAVVSVGVVDVGQGSATVLAQIAAQALGWPIGRIEMVMADTALTPPGHITAGSSTTMSSGSAVKLAAETARNRLLERAAALLGANRAEQRGERFTAPGGAKTASLAEVLAGLPEDIVGEATITPGSKDRIVNSFAAHFAEVEVEMDSGRIRVLRYVAAQDSGRIVNPRLARGQVSGGVLQFLGIALREELLRDAATGVTLNPSFLEHKFTALVDFPAVEVIFAGEPDPVGPYGAKALGEPPVVPVLAAVANAVANATGAWLHEAPFTPKRVLAAIQARGGGGS